MHQEKSQKKNRLTLYIGIALIIGIITGFILNKQYVGTENNRIMNAEVQQKLLQEKMKAFELPKDSVAFQSLIKLQKAVSEKKKAAENSISDNAENTNGVDNLLFIQIPLRNKQTACIAYGYCKRRLQSTCKSKKNLLMYKKQRI